MAQSQTPVFVQTPNWNACQFTSTSSTGVYQTVYHGGVNGSKIVGLSENNNDSATHIIILQLCRVIAGSTVQYGGTTIGTASNDGFGGGAPVNILSPSIWNGLPIDSDGNPYLFLSSTADSLQATFSTSILSAGAVINIVAQGADF